MPADKLGRFMTSPEFLRRANAAVVQACRGLQAKGIAPAWIERGPIGITMQGEQAQEVIEELLRGSEHAALRRQVVELGKQEGDTQRVSEAVRTVARALLLAKTAMPAEGAFQEAIAAMLESVKQSRTLVEIGLLMVDAEAATCDDVFRDRKVISDALFAQRIEAIRNTLILRD
ncbi:hypothetical protein [Paraburkholderia sp. GAS42]|uniref:hypothetical protein n=1 Tax=Paraburkholderia sp. GAS42 TaxID=3035135 RepID=UPI003D1FF024